MRMEARKTFADMGTQADVHSGSAEELRADRDLVLIAATSAGQGRVYSEAQVAAALDALASHMQHGQEAQCAFDVAGELRADCAANHRGDAHVDAAEGPQEDRKVVLAAVANGCDHIVHAAEDMRADCEIVLCAVANDDTAPDIVALRADQDRVLGVIASEGDAHNTTDAAHDNDSLAVSDGFLRTDREIVLAAVIHDESALDAASSAEVAAEKDALDVEAKELPATIVDVDAAPEAVVERLRADRNYGAAAAQVPRAGKRQRRRRRLQQQQQQLQEQQGDAELEEARLQAEFEALQVKMRLNQERQCAAQHALMAAEDAYRHVLLELAQDG